MVTLYHGSEVLAEEERPVDERLSEFAKDKADVGNERSHGNFEHRVNNAINFYERHTPDLFKNPTSEKFSKFLLDVELDYVPTLIGKAMDRGIPFMNAYRENAAVGFVLRDRALRKCEDSVAHSLNPEAFEKRFRWIHFMHLALTHAEFAGASPVLFNPSKATESEKLDFYSLSVEVLSQLAAYGVEHPEDFETTYSWLVDLLKERTKAYSAAVFPGESDKAIAEREKYMTRLRDDIL